MEFVRNRYEKFIIRGYSEQGGGGLTKKSDKNFPIFPGFHDFSPKKAILGQLWPKIPDPETQFTSPNVLI